MHVLGHEDEGVKLVAAFAPVSVESFQEDSDVVLDDKQPSSLPSRERHEVGSGWRDESIRLHEQTSAAKAASFA